MITLFLLNIKINKMITKKNLLEITGILILFAVFISFSNCNETEENNDVATDTTFVKQEVKKTREELIINRDTMKIANPDSITDFEYKHTPEIILGDVDEKGFSKIIVKVGSNGIVHPSVEDHWIDFMTLYIDGKEFKHIENVPGDGSNQHEFFAHLKAGQEIRVVIGCNLHGIWENTLIAD